MFKGVVIGNAGVGKSCVVARYKRGYFTNEITTIGASTSRVALKVKDRVTEEEKSIFALLWDTAGQERFRSSMPIYFRKAEAALLCFDVTDEKSLASIPEWRATLLEYAKADVVMVLVGTKCDLDPNPAIKAKAEALAVEFGLQQICYTSAKSGQGIEELFQYLGEQLYVLQQTRAANPEEGTEGIKGSFDNVNVETAFNNSTSAQNLANAKNDEACC
jgi:Ras-related protein Rab-5C